MLKGLDTRQGLRRMAAGPLLLLALMPAAGRAQSFNDDDDPAVVAQFLSIPQVEGRAYELTASLSTRVDSNFRRRQLNAQSAVRLIPLVRAGVGLPVGRQQLFLGGSVGRDIFIDNAPFNRNRYSIGGGLDLRAGNRCTGTVGAEARSQQLLQTDAVDLADNVQRRNTVGASFNCAGAVGLGFGGSVVWRDQRNQRLQRQLFDLDSLQIVPQISYTSPSLGSFLLSGSYQRVRYPNRAVLTSGGVVEDGVDIRSARLGFARALGTRLTLALGASYIEADPEPARQLLPGPLPGTFVESDREGFSGIGYDATLGLQLGSRMRIAASADRSVSGGGNVGALLRVNDTYALDVNYALNRALVASVGGNVANRDFRGSFASIDEPARRISDRSRRVYAQLNYAPRPRYSAGIEVSHQRRDSNPALFSFSNTVALLRLRASLGR